MNGNVLKYLPIAIVAISFAFGYGQLTSAVADNRTKIEDADKKFQAIDKRLNTIERNQDRQEERNERRHETTGKALDEIKKLIRERP